MASCSARNTISRRATGASADDDRASEVPDHLAIPRPGGEVGKLWASLVLRGRAYSERLPYGALTGGFSVARVA